MEGFQRRKVNTSEMRKSVATYVKDITCRS